MLKGAKRNLALKRQRGEAAPPGGATHNTSGQRLGPKGQETRERIMQATLSLLDGDAQAPATSPPITLSAISRQAGMSMSTLYLYFPDLPELVLAVLRRVAGQNDGAFADCLGTRWPDEELGERTLAFVTDLFAFWQRHARMFQMRNSLADAHEPRLIAYRHESSLPVLEKLAWQMDAAPDDGDCRDYAVVLLTGLERLATILIAPDFAQVTRITGQAERRAYIDRLARAQARVIEITIRDVRARPARLSLERNVADAT